MKGMCRDFRQMGAVYLHPNHFTPDPKIVSGYGLPVTEDGKVLSPFFIMRFASLNAHHGAYANTRTITSTALIECYVLRYAFPKN